jgi:hypothetical protein
VHVLDIAEGYRALARRESAYAGGPYVDEHRCFKPFLILGITFVGMETHARIR